MSWMAHRRQGWSDGWNFRPLDRQDVARKNAIRDFQLHHLNTTSYLDLPQATDREVRRIDRWSLLNRIANVCYFSSPFAKFSF
jgi:hypothetical protein